MTRVCLGEPERDASGKSTACHRLTWVLHLRAFAEWPVMREQDSTSRVSYRLQHRRPSQQKWLRHRQRQPPRPAAAHGQRLALRAVAMTERDG